ncbi:DUF2283 domain-containing protein, partial [Actinomycetota bacterium]
SDAVYIGLKESKYSESDEISNNIILDFDKKGNVIGIEILDASNYLDINELSSVKFEVNKKISKAS